MLRCNLPVLLSCLFANEEDKKAATQLEMFLFKVGFESLLGDVRVVKDKSNLNSKDIANIQNKVQYLYSEYTKNKTKFQD